MRTRLVSLATGAALTALMAGTAQAAPADGNGNKRILLEDEMREEFGFPDTVTCPNGSELTLDLDGWYQVMTTADEDSKSNSRISRRAVFHATLTYTSPDGDTWRYVDVGPDRIFTVGGERYIAITGRLGLAPDPDAPGQQTALYGTVWQNLDTGAVEHIAGNITGATPDELACEALLGTTPNPGT